LDATDLVIERLRKALPQLRVIANALNKVGKTTSRPSSLAQLGRSPSGRCARSDLLMNVLKLGDDCWTQQDVETAVVILVSFDTLCDGGDASLPIATCSCLS
jgi:hypothetical protein